MINNIKTVLIAEKNELIAKDLISIFHQNNFNVGWASDGDAFFEALMERNVDLALIDLSFAYNCDKPTFISHTKAIAPDIEILMMIDSDNVELLNHALMNGASAFIQKPINAEQILLMSYKLLERHGLEEKILNYSLN